MRVALQWQVWMMRLRRRVRPGRRFAAYAPEESRSLIDCDNPVRAADPKAMRDEPAEWDVVDLAADSSFPASDPPAR